MIPRPIHRLLDMFFPEIDSFKFAKLWIFCVKASPMIIYHIRVPDDNPYWMIVHIWTLAFHIHIQIQPLCFSCKDQLDLPPPVPEFSGGRGAEQCDVDKSQR